MPARKITQRSESSWRCFALRKPLFEKIKSLKETGDDFAYFCKFTDQERLHGDEVLFETRERPYLFNKDVRSALDETIPELIRASHVEKPQIPIFTSFSMIQETLGIKSRHERTWPMMGTILPQGISHGFFIRENKTPFNNAHSAVDITRNDQARLEQNISGIVERIREGEALQVVLSQHFEVEEFDGTDILRYLLLNDRSRYVYYYKFGDKEIIGSSPENVFRKKGSTITVNPIAGTRKRYTDSDENLISSLVNDSKELCEHRMLVDLARNDLSRIGIPGSVNVTGNMQPEKFYSVIHLTSSVQAESDPGNSNYSIFSSLFPAGTVSGAPKIRAIEIIDEYETRERGPYGGSVGVIGENDMDMALTIRSAFMNKGKAYTQAGAGIVKDSVPHKEVEEIIAKAGTIMAGGLVCA